MPETSPRLMARPLARSLDPLAGESAGGYLLRLACRLRLTPLRMARLTGCLTGPSSAIVGRRLLVALDIDSFARHTRLAPNEAAALTLLPWADRYPPIARSRPGAARPVAREDWLFNNIARYCPCCLAGDGSPIQQRYGGPWKAVWHLPISFACLDHHMFLQHGCTRSHPSDKRSRLITRAADGGLHPAQCRAPDPEQPGGHNGMRRSCGVRLDQPHGDSAPRPSARMLQTQQYLLDLLGPNSPAADAFRYFTDLRLAVALLSASWPLGSPLIAPSATDAVAAHIHELDARKIVDKPPEHPVATAAMLTAAASLLADADLPGLLAEHIRAARARPPSRSRWALTFARHESACSQGFRQTAWPLTRSYRRTAPRYTKAPTHVGGYRPEHIPAFLEQGWHQKHLAPLHCDRPLVRSLRRAGAALLVQWAAGGSLKDAASFLGINPAGRQYTPTSDLQKWLNRYDPARFTTALNDLADDLDTAADPIDYHRRRNALSSWYLAPHVWREIIANLPPVPGPNQPILDDRKRQEASAFVWAHTTRGEPQFAPRPIEAQQPQDVRLGWLRRRGATWYQLWRPDPVNHYAALRALLTQYADQLTEQIDSGAEVLAGLA